MFYADYWGVGSEQQTVGLGTGANCCFKQPRGALLAYLHLLRRNNCTQKLTIASFVSQDIQQTIEIRLQISKY